MTTKTAAILVLVLFGCALCVTMILYPSLPGRIPTNFTFDGEPNRWLGKAPSLLGLLALILVFLLFIFAGDWISPTHFKVKEFRSAFNYIMVIAAALTVYALGFVLLAALHPARMRGRWMTSGLFLFIAWLGNWLGKTRRNFWIGIRTPWALANDSVWIATHRLAARIFTAVGIIGALGAFIRYPKPVYLVLLAIMVLVPVVYSFWISKKLESTPEADH